MTTCTSCGATKSREEFGLHNGRKSGLQAHCKSCRAARTARDKEKTAAYKRAYYLANRERVRAKNLAYEMANRKKAVERTKRWQQANPERKRAHAAATSQKRRHLARGVYSEPVDRDYIYLRDSGICHICTRKVARREMTLDHLIPLSHGGEFTALNLRVAHRSCNSSRGPGRLPAQLLLVA